MRNIFISLVAVTTLVCVNTSALFASGVTSVNFVPPGLSPGDTYHIAFVTSGTRDAFSTDIDDYNAFVQAQALISGAITEDWNVSWRAIGSTSSIDARDNAVVTAPVFLLDGTLVASGATQMWSGNLQPSSGGIHLDQYGNDASGQYVWTGSFGDGSGFGDSNYELGGISGTTAGLSGQENGAWLGDNVHSSSHHLYPMYALSEVVTVVPEPTTFGMSLLFTGFGTVGGFARRRQDRPFEASKM